MLERTVTITVKPPAAWSDAEIASMLKPDVRDTIAQMRGEVTGFDVETTDVPDEDLELAEGEAVEEDPATLARMAAVRARADWVVRWRETHPGWTTEQCNHAITLYDLEHGL